MGRFIFGIDFIHTTKLGIELIIGWLLGRCLIFGRYIANLATAEQLLLFKEQGNFRLPQKVRKTHYLLALAHADWDW